MWKKAAHRKVPSQSEVSFSIYRPPGIIPCMYPQLSLFVQVALIATLAPFYILSPDHVVN